MGHGIPGLLDDPRNSDALLRDRTILLQMRFSGQWSGVPFCGLDSEVYRLRKRD